jgi:4-amino-4-deoxy-L-arabinose transferase-like glycosyltransferase
MRRRVAILAGVALIVRVLYAAVFLRGYVPKSDADSYYALGKSLAHGHGFAQTLPFDLSHATAFRPPLYPAVVSIAFRAFGAHVGVAQGVSILAGTGAVVVGACLASRIAGERAGLVAGLLLALYPPILANDTTVLVESLAVLLALACVLALVDGRTVVGGVLLALLMLDRASAQWLVVVFAAWVLWKFGARHAVRFVLVALAVVAPWVVRNAIDVGAPVLVTTNGFNLNAVYSAEASHDDGFVDANFDPRFSRLRLDAFDEAKFDDALRARALQHLRSDPSRLAHVLATNTLQWFELQPGRNHVPEVLDGRNLSVRAWSLPLFYVVTAAGIAGLVLSRRRLGAQLLLLLAGYVSVVSIASIAVPRLRSLFDACTAVGAAVVLTQLFPGAHRAGSSDAPPRRPLRTRASVLVLVAVFAVVAVGGFQWRGHMRSRSRRLVVEAIARDAGALPQLRNETLAAGDAPPRYAAEPSDQLRDLAQVLTGAAAAAPPSVHAQFAVAQRAVRLAARQLDVVALLSAAQYVHPTGPRPSLAAVREFYEAKVLPDDASMPLWAAVISGSTFEDARTAVASLTTALAATGR